MESHIRFNQLVARCVLTVAFVLMTMMLAVVPAHASTSVIHDSNLDAVVRTALGKGPLESITASDMALLEDLNADGMNIVDLGGLEHAVNLWHLSVADNQITAITPLAGLTNLSWLELRDNQITDITPVADMTGLTFSLDLQGNRITDISPLAGLTSLECILLGNNQITDIAAVAGMSSLTFLDCQQNQIVDISPVAGLTNLTNLGASCNWIGDMGPVAGLAKLEELDLTQNEITGSLAPVAGLTKLRVLYLHLNRIGGIIGDSLSNKPRLAVLYLYANNLTFTSRDLLFLQSLSDRGAILSCSPQNEAASTLCGTVTNWDGLPLSGVRAALGWFRPVTTGADGRYTKICYPGGMGGGLMGVFSKTGYVSQTFENNVPFVAGATTVTDVVLLRPGLRGIVTGPGGAPLSGVTVALGALAPVTTHADGSYSVACAVPGTYTVTFSKVRFISQSFATIPVVADAISTKDVALRRAYANVGTPKAPLTMYRTRYYTVYGYLKPRHTSGTYPVRIYKYRYVSGRWRSYGYVRARAANYSSYTKYSVKMRLPYRGKWYLRAYAPTDSGHAATWSSSHDHVTVK